MKILIWAREIEIERYLASKTQNEGSRRLRPLVRYSRCLSRWSSTLHQNTYITKKTTTTTTTNWNPKPKKFFFFFFWSRRKLKLKREREYKADLALRGRSAKRSNNWKTWFSTIHCSCCVFVLAAVILLLFALSALLTKL